MKCIPCNPCYTDLLLKLAAQFYQDLDLQMSSSLRQRKKVVAESSRQVVSPISQAVVQETRGTTAAQISDPAESTTQEDTRGYGYAPSDDEGGDNRDLSGDEDDSDLGESDASPLSQSPVSGVLRGVESIALDTDGTDDLPLVFAAVLGLVSFLACAGTLCFYRIVPEVRTFISPYVIVRVPCNVPTYPAGARDGNLDGGSAGLCPLFVLVLRQLAAARGANTQRNRH